MSFIQANNTCYSINNAQGGTCMDLSAGDKCSVTGFPYHEGSNQQWMFESAGGDKTFNVKCKDGKYLSLAGEPSDGQKVVGSDASFAWRVEDDSSVDGGVRLSPANNPKYCVDLAEHGASAAGTAIQLWSRWEGQNQVWKVQQVQNQ